MCKARAFTIRIFIGFNQSWKVDTECQSIKMNEHIFVTNQQFEMVDATIEFSKSKCYHSDKHTATSAKSDEGRGGVVANNGNRKFSIYFQ